MFCNFLYPETTVDISGPVRLSPVRRAYVLPQTRHGRSPLRSPAYVRHLQQDRVLYSAFSKKISKKSFSDKFSYTSSVYLSFSASLEVVQFLHRFLLRKKKETILTIFLRPECRWVKSLTHWYSGLKKIYSYPNRWLTEDSARMAGKSVFRIG